MFRYFCLFLFLLSKLSGSEDDIYPYLPYAREIISDFADEMKEKYGLHCYGKSFVHGETLGCITVLSIMKKKCNIEEAREMELIALECLLKKVNAHKKIQPFLRKRPFKYENVDVRISFRGDNYEWPLDGSVAVVYNCGGKFTYEENKIVQEKGLPYFYKYKDGREFEAVREWPPEPKLVTLFEEPLEEALKYAKKETASPSLPLSP